MRKRCRPNADVIARALKFGVFVKKHPSHAAPVVARAQTLMPGRTRCRSCACGRRRPDAGVVAQTQALSPGRRRRRRSAEVWGVCEKTPLPRATRRRTGADIVARAHALSPARMRSRAGAGVSAWAYTSSSEQGYFAQAPTALVARRCRRAGAGVVARAGPVCARTSEGIKGPGFPSLLTFLPSEASWPGPALQQFLARTSRIGLFLLCYLFM